jgi:hypothetical protein
MIGRVLAISRTALIEALRARLTPVAALALLAAVPLLALLFSEDADTRAWLTRSITAEGLRVVLPLAAIIGGGFLLKPAVKRGWTVLPARRAEYFVGAALAGAIVLALGAGLFAVGGVAANSWFDRELTVTASSSGISKQRGTGADREVTPATGEATWADPRHGEELVLDVPTGLGRSLRGTVEFQMIWTAEAPPRDRSPVAIWLQSDAGRHQLETTVQSRYRVEFAGDYAGEGTLIVQPTDPVLIVGTTPEKVRIELEQVGPVGSVARLLALSVCAGVLCLLLVLFVRSLATAPTAVLAGLLLLATLTLLPSLAPAGRMARDRRAAMARGDQPNMAQRLELGASELPPLFPDVYYDEYLAARLVPAKSWLDAGLRLLAGLALLPAGAWLFRLRQIAK